MPASAQTAVHLQLVQAKFRIERLYVVFKIRSVVGKAIPLLVELRCGLAVLSSKDGADHNQGGDRCE
jgi:hypothetical protein